MQVDLRHWKPSEGWSVVDPTAEDADLVLVFGGAGDASLTEPLATLRGDYPGAEIVGCSTAGEILGVEVWDDTLTAAALSFDEASIAVAEVQIGQHPCSYAAGQQLAGALPADGLKHVLVFSDGLSVNGSDLARGMTDALPSSVPVTGGLAADGGRFERTQVIFNDSVGPAQIAAVGFYGEGLQTGYGSLGGWDVFGPDRVITRSEGNVLYELDGQSALDLYKQYLGDYAAELPGSGLLFPLQIQTEDGSERVVRTILGVDEQTQSMTFAGDMPVGAQAQLMRANFDRLVDGAMGAAGICRDQQGHQSAWQFGLLISCVGRKMVLQQRVEEEVEAVRMVLGEDVPLAGFYSYGELAPFVRGDSCKLHNQTMTITTFSERCRA